MVLSDYLPNALKPAPPETLGNCSAEEKTKAEPARAAMRDTLIALKKTFNANADALGLSTSQRDNTLSDVTQEKQWWDENLVLCPADVSLRTRKWQEESDAIFERIAAIYYAVLEVKPEPERNALLARIGPPEIKQKLTERLDKQFSGAKQAEVKKKAAEEEELKSRTIWDEVKIAFRSAMGWLVPILYVLVALRLAGYAANDTFYKPFPYRVLAFIYTFLFAPFLLLYYLYRLFFSEPEEQLIFEGVFPLYPYDPNQEVTLFSRFFGYPWTDSLHNWVDKKRAAWEVTQAGAVVGTADVLAGVIKAKEEALAKN